MDLNASLKITTTEMHTGGEPLRIIESVYLPEIAGNTVLDKRHFLRENLDHFRKFLMFEPRGHFDMYGAILVKSELPEAHFGVIFIHNEGYSTMCGHGVIALGRYALDKGLVKPAETPGCEVQVNMHCPCGLVKAYVNTDGGKSGRVRFHSVPAFAFALGTYTCICHLLERIITVITFIFIIII